jgi:hypothetical protein
MYDVFGIEATIFVSLFPLPKAILFQNLNQRILVLKNIFQFFF